MIPPLSVQHVDLCSAEDVLSPDCDAAFIVFWWKSLPLGAKIFLRQELPLSRAQLLELLAHYAGEQVAARNPFLGAPLRPTHEGQPSPVLRLQDLRRVKDIQGQLDEWSMDTHIWADKLSVIVCTRDRQTALFQCLQSLSQQHSAPGEIIVVDNSQTESAREVCSHFPSVMYVSELTPGLSAARNKGLRASTKEFVAFTDDDVEAHPNWTAAIVRAFVEQDTEGVTGLVLPAKLDTPAERFFQFHMGGFHTNFVPLLFDAGFFDQTQTKGIQVWKIGAGANMAFRRSIFDRVGFFDERLGAGASGCSEDSELWYRILALGGRCFYDPRAVVFHHHRPSWGELRIQVRAYLRGHVSALVVQHDKFNDRSSIRRISRQLPAYFLRSAVGAMLRGPGGRGQILIEEFIGWLQGLQYLMRARWRRGDRTTHPRFGAREQ